MMMMMMIRELEQSQADLSHPEQTVSSSDSSPLYRVTTVMIEAAIKKIQQQKKSIYKSLLVSLNAMSVQNTTQSSGGL